MEEKLPALIQKMLLATIERNPPVFPWERETEEDRHRAKTHPDGIAYIDKYRPNDPLPEK